MDERQFDHPEDPPGTAGDLAAGGPSSGPPPDADPPVSESPQALVDRLTAAARTQAAVVALETAALVDTVAALRPLEVHYGMTWRQWVAWQCGLTTAEARRVCLLADKLPRLPLLDAAFRSGSLSDGITEKLARVATPANEHAVLAAAQAATAAQLEQVVRDFRQVRAGATPPAGASVEDPATMPSEASWSWDEHGRHRGSWNLRADDGAILEAALELALAQFRSTEADIDVADGDGDGNGDVDHGAEDAPSHDSVRADDASDGDDGADRDARAEGAGGRDHATDRADDDSRSDDRRTPHPTDSAAVDHERAPLPPSGSGASGAGHRPHPASAHVAEGTLRPDEKALARRPDALVAFANLVLSSKADDGLLPESAQVILHHNLTPTGRLDADGALRADPDPHPDPEAPEVADPVRSLTGAVIPGCGAVPDWLAQKLSCDALVITVAMIAGFPVSEPTAERFFNRARRRAMRARDRHCRFPGCARTRHLHAHHTKPYGRSRRTSVADAVLLCEQHHTLVHLRGYTIALGIDHVVTVTRPDGTVLRSTPMPPPDPCTLARRPRGPKPPPDRRRTGTKEPLTRYARDALATSWHLADVAAAVGAAAGDPDPPTDPDPDR